ncbi:hypothetical protein [Arthrobacter sp. NIO-1057]|nr:hypothetical protein [Arthrobacter sp. NIO-1057]
MFHRPVLPPVPMEMIMALNYAQPQGQDPANASIALAIERGT